LPAAAQLADLAWPHRASPDERHDGRACYKEESREVANPYAWFEPDWRRERRAASQMPDTDRIHV